MSTYSIVYSSMTGNTAALADQLRALLPAEDCLYFGDPSREAVHTEADLVFVGFWTDKGSCDPATRVFLKKLNNKTIILFGTAGCEIPEYHQKVMAEAAKEADVSNTVLPGFMCQGRMKPGVKEKALAALAADPEDAKAKHRLAEYEAALSHPNESDYQALAEWVNAFVLKNEL